MNIKAATEKKQVHLFTNRFEEYWNYVGKPFAITLLEYVQNNFEMMKYIKVQEYEKTDQTYIYFVPIIAYSYLDVLCIKSERTDETLRKFENLKITTETETETEHLDYVWPLLVEEFYEFVRKHYIMVNKVFKENKENIPFDKEEFMILTYLFEAMETSFNIKFNIKYSSALPKIQNLDKKYFLFKSTSHYITEDNEIMKRGRYTPTNIKLTGSLVKYWCQRYRLFLKYDNGIMMDDESWWSVTPEEIARHQAEKAACGILIDPFCGSGGNVSQYASTCNFVVANDHDPGKIKNAKNNAKIYGVSEYIDFVIADGLFMLNCAKADGVFISAPWGGPSYLGQSSYCLETTMTPNALDIFKNLNPLTQSLTMLMPKNANIRTLINISSRFEGLLEIELNLINNKIKAKSAYFGRIVL